MTMLLVERLERVSIPVPRHGLDLPTGTLRAICRDAGWELPPQR
jgi:hypothetical protein